VIDSIQIRALTFKLINLWPYQMVRNSQLDAVTDKVAKVANSWRWDKGRFDHAAHEQVTDPTGILTVGFVSLLWFGLLGIIVNG
jgi:hypothetical protein